LPLTLTARDDRPSRHAARRVAPLDPDGTTPL